MQSKKEIVEAINQAFIDDNKEGFLDHCTEDTEWTMVGETTKIGKTAIREWMTMADCEPPKFTVTELVCEGDTVVCSGDMTMKGEDGVEGSFSFCDIYHFSGDKVAKLTTFVIKTDQSGKTASA